MSLPQGLNLGMMQNTWATSLNPVIAFPPNKGLLLKNIALINGATTINHLLGRKMQGWLLIDQDASANIYRSQPLNDLTLTLTSNAAVNISLWCF